MSRRPEPDNGNHGYSKEEREFYIAQYNLKVKEIRSLKRGWENFPEKNGRKPKKCPTVELIREWIKRQEVVMKLKEAEEEQEKETSK